MKAGVKVNRLTHAQMFKLGDLIRVKYTESGLDNVKFAAFASETLGIQVSRQTVERTVNDLELPQNRPMSRRQTITVGDCIGLVQRVAALEDQVSKLAMYIKQKGL